MKTLLAGISVTLATLVAPVVSAESMLPAANLQTNRPSTFSSETRRNPFLPIGYTRKVERAAAPKTLAVTPDMFVVTAIILGTPPIAIINGRDRTIGDRVPVPNGGSEFVTVARIEDGQVVLRHHERELPVPQGRRR